jgi:hypothetical protein
MKKSKCSTKAHLWFSPLSPMARLTMIAPKDDFLKIYYIKQNHVYKVHMYSLLHIAIQKIETTFNSLLKHN